ncbi:MAG: hypothetical protein ACT4OI_06850 [Methanobacteriota archaeon]
MASSAAAFTDADQDGVDDLVEAKAERTIDYHGTPTVQPITMRLSSASVASPLQDWFRVGYEAGEFTVVYLRESPNGLVTSSFDLQLKNLVEWRDLDGDGAYEPGSNESVRVLPLGDTAFGGSSVSHWTNGSADGGEIHSMRIRSSDNEVTLELMIAQRFLRLAPDRVLTPMEMKLNVTIDHPIPSADLGIALALDIDTDYPAVYESRSWGATHNFASDESWINVTRGSGEGASTVFMSWANNATVDGATRRVARWGPTTDSGSGSYDFFLAYPAGTDANASRIIVEHDPTLGVVSAAYGSVLQPFVEPRDLQGDPVLYAGSAAAIAALVATTMVLAKRRRGRA